ncbi:PAS domain S-box protein [Leptospira wolffii]|uniref:PAS domain S-box protein n=1 Tax=Leptospira wolffii TaxID=409998 RepID=UPI000344A5A5|nr:PAS domain S-box protein [Leptospira wolffii]
MGEDKEKDLPHERFSAFSSEIFLGVYKEEISLKEGFSKILSQLYPESKAIAGEIWILDPSGKILKSASRVFGSKVDSEEREIPVSDLMLSVLESKSEQIVIYSDLEDSDRESFSGYSENVGSIYVSPFSDEDNILGIFVFYYEGKEPEGSEKFLYSLRIVSRCIGSLVASKMKTASLAESEAKMRNVLENMPIMFLAVDDSFEFVAWNLESERVLGYSKEEVLGTKNFLHERLLKQEEKETSYSVDTGLFDSDFKNWELELLAKDGKPRTISLSNISSEYPLPGWGKWFVGVDITRTKEVERDLKSSLKELSDFQTALNAVSIVAITDRAGTIIYVNQNFCNISGYSRDELLGQNHRIINSGYHTKEFFKELWKKIAKGEIWKGEIKNQAKDGRFYWVDTTISPILDEKGKPYQYLAIRNDITERKETEEKARHAENNLKTLQDRMSPHFLFNTLSIIHSYLQTNPELADSAILMLADNYRFLTDHANKQLVPFDIEWEFMENYLKLLKLRFSDFLDIEVEKKGDFRKCQLPPLTLQPLVENSYIHGLRDKKGKGKISVKAFTEGTKTHIVVRDDGVGLKNQKLQSRTLSNISERLKFYLYESEVKIENHPEGGAVVTVTFDNPKNEELAGLIRL